MTRISTLNLVATLSSCQHEADGADEQLDHSQMFADSFLEQDEVTEKSLVDHVLLIGETEDREMSRDELDCILTIIGNFSVDGIDAREKLCVKVINSKFLTWISEMIKSNNELAELGLWAIEGLMMEQGKKSVKKLSVNVYAIVKDLYDNQTHQYQFWSLLAACTAHSKVNCVRAHDDFYQMALGVIKTSLDFEGHGISDFIIEHAWLTLVNISGRGPLNMIVQSSELLDLVYLNWVKGGRTVLHKFGW